MNQADILAEKVLDDVLEETVIEMQRWVISMHAILLKILNDYKIKRKQKGRLGILIAHTHGLQDCHHHLHAVFY